MSQEQVSRRSALTGGAAAIAGVGAALAVSAVARDAHADNAADATQLNGVLTKAYEIIAVYDSAIGAATSAGADGAVAVALFTHFRTQHNDEATALAAQITSLSGTPVVGATVNPPANPAGFSRTVPNYLKYMANLERQNAVLNIARLNAISSKDGAALVAAVVGTQTQHFTILNLLVRGIATPGPMAAANVNDIVPRSFVAIDANPAGSLTSVADIPFGTT